ncbi:hypothetical protein [Janibacter indicus]|uniref:hypothetical protein n=1 Tax=Janibacter indicus TaxID=857417 RepID=UPI00117ADAB7|nr:hypothetical protein [Janibacter indicus]
MNAERTDAHSDGDLLNLAKAVLSEQGFHIESVNANVKLLLAENSYFVVAVAAMSTTRDLVLAESAAFNVLVDRIESVALGPKKWDTYLVLLTQENLAEDDDVTRDIYSINYDTSRLRRIAHTGVAATPKAVGHALAPFFEPASSAMSAAQDDALDELLKVLVARGVDHDLAHRSVAAFDQGASLDDIL